MTEHAIGSLIGFILVLLTAAHLLGNLFARLRQPRVIGEILAGVLVGPSLLRLAAPAEQLGGKAALDLLYWIGLLLLMFASGAGTRHLFRGEERRQGAWLAAMGARVAFIISLLI